MRRVCRKCRRVRPQLPAAHAVSMSTLGTGAGALIGPSTDSLEHGRRIAGAAWLSPLREGDNDVNSTSFSHPVAKGAGKGRCMLGE
eukprot:scaffold185211_cov32-Tisochrysis_lutea.AAC.3